MKSKRKMYKKSKRTSRRSKKIKRGGGLFDFFTGSKKVVPSQCDPNNLSQLKTSEQLRENYQTCCPKTFFGMRKNSSPYCKQVELNANAAVEGEGLEKQFVGAEPLEVAEMKDAPMVNAPIINDVAAAAPEVNNPVPEINPVPPPIQDIVPSDEITLMGGRRKRRRTRRKNRKSRSKSRRHR